MEGQFRILCERGRHVHVLDRAEMVKVFGELTVSEIDAGTRRIPVTAPSCMECDEDEEQPWTGNNLSDFALEMSAQDI
jgi:hypothetical protein